MEPKTMTRTLAVPETVFDDVTECPVDCSFTLPDYLPEIAAVLKCLMKPVIQSHQISGDRVVADGTVYLQLLYLDEERRCVRNFEYSQPFTAAFTVKDLKSSDDITLTAKAGYLNCRATGPRGADVHGAFAVRLKVVTLTPTEVITTVEENSLFSKGEELCHTIQDGYAQKQFTINEVLETGTIFPAEQLLRNEAAVLITECKQLPEKAIVKGDILLKTYYVTDTQTGTMGCSKNRIPFSQIIDVEGLSEQTMCECHAELLLCDVHVTQNGNGDNSLLSVTLKVNLILRTYVEERCAVITDAFHTQYPLKLQTKRIIPTRIVSLQQENQLIKQLVDLPDGDIAEIVDVWCDIVPTETHCENQTAKVDARLTVCMVTRDGNGILSYYERMADFSCDFSESCEQMAVWFTLIDCDYTRNGKQLELQLQVSILRKCMVSNSILAVTALSADETAPYKREEGMEHCSLKAYFASPGECVWEIAKAEHASPWQLQEENEISEDVLKESTMLLIPFS